MEKEHGVTEGPFYKGYSSRGRCCFPTRRVEESSSRLLFETGGG
ncbi:MAG: hypothetical protein AVDCRST_MAG78-2982 [uncultured Rubrobacteraceae bacterium]|uniref:Uncharacterized protein n=1 Tax=uncultured Rubrobacteraceae bacterium TaxID=349277 RepID=A0A6J4QND4_9ACTN|nr:MAG: hypothetical protein AVDCRST_MAG78-2982 [uncultured Rubrobacteraceae bacterium]